MRFQVKRFLLSLLILPSCSWTPPKNQPDYKTIIVVEDYIIGEEFDCVFRDLYEIAEEDYYEVYDNDTRKAHPLSEASFFQR